MSLRTSAALVAVVLLLASGFFSPGAAGPTSSTSSGPSESVIPPSPAAGDGLDPLAEPPAATEEAAAGGTPTEAEAAPTEAAPTEVAPTEAAPTEVAPTEAEQASGDPSDATAQPETPPQPQPETAQEADQEPDADAYTVVINDRVQFFMDRYTGNSREIIGIWLTRSGTYLDMIRDVFRARGLPEDLCYIAMIESGFNPRAVSRAGAKGMWQFMAPTARRYGLRVDKWVDERLDPVKSTSAAAAYLTDLHRLFGSWPLAKAAYNAGEYKVARAIQATGASDFWTLAQSRFLRQETKDFVPAIHAATLIARDPARYGFDPGRTEESSTGSSVSVPPSTDLRTLAVRAGLPWATLRVLNPALIRGVTPPDRRYQLTVPDDAVGRVTAALATRIGRDGRSRVPYDVHIVQPGDTIRGIAKRYGITAADLARWNKLEQPDRIRPGDRLRVAELQVTVVGGARAQR